MTDLFLIQNLVGGCFYYNTGSVFMAGSPGENREQKPKHRAITVTTPNDKMQYIEFLVLDPLYRVVLLNKIMKILLETEEKLFLFYLESKGGI